MGLLDSIANVGLALFQNKQNRKLAREQRSFDREMWEKTNEYNSPAQQMLRLKGAGLNPNLVYGSGSVSGNTSPASMPKYEIPRQETPQVSGLSVLPAVNTFMSVLSQFQNIKQSKAQEDLARKKADLIDQETSTEFWKSLLTQVKANEGNQDYIFKRDTMEDRKKGIVNQNSLLQTRNNMLLFDLFRSKKKMEDVYPLEVQDWKNKVQKGIYENTILEQDAINAPQLGRWNMSPKDGATMKFINAVMSALFGYNTK